MEHNADYSVVSAVTLTHRRGRQSISLLPEMVYVCYVQSYPYVCAMCSIEVFLGGDDYKGVVCGCISASHMPKEEHAKRVGVAMPRSLTSSQVVHMAALCLLCSMVPWSPGG
jgi:hypothetical protein